jgi:hypothetical protein
MDTHKAETLMDWMQEELNDHIRNDFITTKELYMLTFGHGAYWVLDRTYDYEMDDLKPNKGEL